MSRIVVVPGRIVPAALFAVVLVLLFAQTGGHAETGDALPYSGGVLVTGNYVVGGVDLTEELNPPDVNGFSTGTINMSGIPADAEIVTAYLYWETITLTADLSQANGVKFRNQEILLDDAVGVQKRSQPLVDATATCWSSGTPLTMTRFRADVLRYLPIRLDKDNQPTPKSSPRTCTGKRLRWPQTCLKPTV